MSQMMQLRSVIDIKSEVIVSSEAPLTAPSTDISAEEVEKISAVELENQTEQAAQVPVPQWLVVAKNRRVNRDWESLLSRAPAQATRCYEDLCTAPMTRKAGRIFPLKGKRYKGAWEYEVTRGDRVFYVPDTEQGKVIVYYAGAHPKNAPVPE